MPGPGEASGAATVRRTLRVERRSIAERTRVRVGPVEVGGDGFVVMAGPCAVEGGGQLTAAARAVVAGGGHVLRGGAYKPRTSPYSFQGLGEDGVALLAEIRSRTGLPVVTEVMESSQIAAIAEHVDLLQVGARNMQNFPLLRALARQRRPVMLKRGAGCTIDEWLLAAEYLLDGGNDQVVLCERGVRTFETATRNTLDLAGAALARERTHLPVIIDPSHATGRSTLVPPMVLAAAAAGFDGVLVEVHAEPARALCDGAQALDPAAFLSLMRALPPLLEATGRSLHERSPRKRGAVGGT